MTIIGYARVSTTDQDLAIQINVLKAAGCEVIRSEKRSGTTTEGRAELRTVLDFLRSGDVLVVTRIDRLARSIGDLQDIVFDNLFDLSNKYFVDICTARAHSKQRAGQGVSDLVRL